ncbi:NUDIX hydrolase domain-like protein [Mycena epipterygia]|nr:NUDIX hydrolase domain-like protein [Mycena epipterygia]
MATNALSYLDIVNICANTRIRQPTSSANTTNAQFDPGEQLVPLHLTPAPTSPIVGLLRPQIVDLLAAENERSLASGGAQIWSGLSAIPGLTATKISFGASLTTHGARTAAMQAMCERWRDGGVFPDVIGPKKWRAEMYAVYRDPFGVHDHPGADADEEGKLNFAFEMERAACALFGIITYGVHMNMYQTSPDGKSLRIWVPRRAANKSMWPGYLDNTVAGGIPSGMPIFEALVKECMEEASLCEDLVRAHTRAVGCISYFFRTAKGWLQPEVEYVYDLVIPPGADPAPFEPKPLDGEVESFDFLDQVTVEREMRAGRFKPNCALVLIDLLIRLGYITPDSEPDYLKIMTALHGGFDYERW